MKKSFVVGAGFKPARQEAVVPAASTYPRRRTVRLTAYDYATPAAYFVTICTHQRALLFERPDHAAAVLAAWEDLPRHYAHASLDQFVVMPNHVHGIVLLADSDALRAGFKPTRQAESAPHHGLPEVVRAFKTFSARSVNRLRDRAGQPVWQRGYYEHVIRGERSLARIREYIAVNPGRWDSDGEGPAGRPDASERAFWTACASSSRPSATRRPGGRV